jgi:hypothetical protein
MARPDGWAMWSVDPARNVVLRRPYGARPDWRATDENAIVMDIANPGNVARVNLPFGSAAQEVLIQDGQGAPSGLP